MKTPEEMAEEYATDKRREWDDYVVDEAKAGFLAGYKAAKEQLADAGKVMPQWISVKDRLPEINELCIVNTEWRGVVPATYGNESWIFDEGQGWSEKVLSYVTHWMPLPEAPKEEK